jgi:iron complex outermembrane receptor protein
MKTISTLLLLLLSATLVWADEYENIGIKGKVTTSDGNPAPAVTVQLKDRSRGTLTNDKGEFTFNKLAPGAYTVQVSLIGYEPTEQTVIVTADKHASVTIRLAASDKQLQEVEVKAARKRYQVSNVSSSLRLTTPLLETPQNIQVITSKLLADQQAFDMLESVTRNVSGVTRTEHWDNYARINMRGSQVAAFRNGMNIQMPWGPLTEDMSMVERIEFVKGPAGFMMANGEPSGFYNVVTKKPTGVTKGEAAITIGSFDTYRATLDLDGKLNRSGKLLYRLNLMGQLKGSHRPFDYNNRYTIAPALTYQFNDRTSLTAEYTYQYSKMAMIGAAYLFSPNGYGDQPRNSTTVEKNLAPTYIKDHSAFLIFNHKFNEQWKLTAQAAYFNFGQTGSSIWPTSLDSAGNMARGATIWDAKGENKQAQVFVNGDVSTGAVGHRILGGVDMGQRIYLADFTQSFALNGTKGAFNVFNPVYGTVPDDSLPKFDRSKKLADRAGYKPEQKYIGFYVQDELHFWEDRIRLTLAGRYTLLNMKDASGEEVKEKKFTPRVGLSVSIDKQTAVYALYDQAFVPQVGFLYPDSSAAKPLTGSNIEAGLKRDWLGGRWNTTLAAYRIVKDNVLSADPEHINYSIQIGQTQTQGVEFDVRGELVKGLNLTLNYAFTESKITKNTDPEKIGDPVPGSAKHLTNGWLSYRIPAGALEGLGISLGYQWQIDRSTWQWPTVNQKELPDYFRLDGALSWQHKQYNVALNVNNLLNKYLYSGSPYATYYYWQAEPGTNFRLSLGYRF